MNDVQIAEKLFGISIYSHLTISDTSGYQLNIMPFSFIIKAYRNITY